MSTGERAYAAAVAQGVPAFAAMAAQVTGLMWLRTTVNYQYRTGLPMVAAFRALAADGGLRRFYAGYSAAIVQAPLSRFADVAANAATLTLLDATPATAALPIAAKTAAASTAAALARIALMPIDTVKTALQVHGSAAGLALLRAKLRAAGGSPAPLFHGALGASAATLVGHYPWFATFNTLTAAFPRRPDESRATTLGRAAAIGFAASAVSDTVSNAFRVVKTIRQTAAPLPAAPAAGYLAIARDIVARDGVVGLVGRGLKTKIIANGIQGLTFSVLWRLGQDAFNAPPPIALKK